MCSGGKVNMAWAGSACASDSGHTPFLLPPPTLSPLLPARLPLSPSSCTSPSWLLQWWEEVEAGTGTPGWPACMSLLCLMPPPSFSSLSFSACYLPENMSLSLTPYTILFLSLSFSSLLSLLFPLPLPCHFHKSLGHGQDLDRIGQDL